MVCGLEAAVRSCENMVPVPTYEFLAGGVPYAGSVYAPAIELLASVCAVLQGDRAQGLSSPRKAQN